MVVVVIWLAVLPLLMPVLMKDRLLSLPTIIDADGICLQSTDYTCAPAAAVTALGKLGFSDQEGRLALLSYSNPITGTLPTCLENALQTCYGSRGLDCHYRHFDSVEQLKGADLTLAIVKSSFLYDHCLVVLEVSDKHVYLADPAFGKVQMTRSRFEKVWRFTGIALKSNSAGGS
jgi:ABC-type bacteriocin/lantibiotic exporter with double-glycine peptidase domain